MPLFDSHVYVTVGMQTREQIKQSMDRYGIDAVAMADGLAASCDFVEGNRRLKEIVDEEDGLYGYVTLNHDYPEESLLQQRLYLHRREFLGAVFFGRPGEPVTLEGVRDLANAHRRYLKPLLIDTPALESVMEARKIAEEFQQIRFVFLSMGGDAWRAAVDTAKKLLNVHLEISGSVDAEKIAYACENVSSRKLLFGSALPYADPNLFKGLVEDARSLTSGDRRRIYMDNAMGLYSLDAEVE